MNGDGLKDLLFCDNYENQEDSAYFPTSDDALMEDTKGRVHIFIGAMSPSGDVYFNHLTVSTPTMRDPFVGIDFGYHCAITTGDIDRDGRDGLSASAFAWDKGGASVPTCAV